MDKKEIRDFLNKSYKSWKNRFVIDDVSDDSITIWDFGARVPYRFIAKKLIKKYDLEFVHIKLGGMCGNGWIFTKNSLGIK